jgi:uncharacterized protein
MINPSQEHDPSAHGGRLEVIRDLPVRHSLFFTPNGLRAGWRLLIFFALVSVFGTIVSFNPSVQRMFHVVQASGVTTPATLIVIEGSEVIALILAAAVMTRIEKRSLADYGLPLLQAFRKGFWLGSLVGFLALTALLGLLAAFHAYSAAAVAITGRDMTKYGLLYAIGFLLVATFEEFLFRGYLQSTLASGIGFWPAAVVLAVVFGSVHLGNRGETKLGALTAGLFGLVAAFSLFRTGNLWFAIGLHAAWDWGETFFYSVPDSGILARGHLLNASFHGSTWLTGGSVGPEGSIVALPTLLLMALAIHVLFPLRHTD